MQSCNPDGPRPWLFPQLVRIVRHVIDEKVQYADDLHDRRELSNLRYAVLIRDRTLAALRSSEHRALLPVLNEYSLYGSTDHIDFRTAKECVGPTRSHLSHAVCDSKLEAGIVAKLDLI